MPIVVINTPPMERSPYPIAFLLLDKQTNHDILFKVQCHYLSPLSYEGMKMLLFRDLHNSIVADC